MFYFIVGAENSRTDSAQARSRDDDERSRDSEEDPDEGMHGSSPWTFAVLTSG